jgi:hypothetical protein
MSSADVKTCLIKDRLIAGDWEWNPHDPDLDDIDRLDGIATLGRIDGLEIQSMDAGQLAREAQNLMELANRAMDAAGLPEGVRLCCLSLADLHFYGVKQPALRAAADGDCTAQVRSASGGAG